MVQLWSALVLSAILAGALVALVGVAERITVSRMGVRPA
jgi:NitT/TauT family transport system permease protein